MLCQRVLKNFDQFISRYPADGIGKTAAQYVFVRRTHAPPFAPRRSD